MSSSSESDSEGEGEPRRKQSRVTKWRKTGRTSYRFNPKYRDIAMYHNQGPNPDGHHGTNQNCDHDILPIPPEPEKSVADPEEGAITQPTAEAAQLSSGLEADLLEDSLCETSDNEDHSSDSEWSEYLDIHHSDNEDGAVAGSAAADDETEILGDEEDFVPRGDYDDDDDDDNDNDDEQQPQDVDGNFDFNVASLDQHLITNKDRTVREALVLDLALMIRHKWTYDSLIDHFKAKNVLFGQKYFPTSKSELWKTLGRNKAGIVTQVYCDCSYYLGRKTKLPAHVKCKSCNKNVVVSKAKVFLTLSLRKQLEAFLSDPDVQQHFKKARRPARDGEVIADVFDGKLYQDNQDSWGEYDGTYVANTDGCKIGKNAKTSINPFFIRLNELPPHLRQKFVFLAGIFCDKGDPNMQAFLKPIVKELNSLKIDGVKWHDHQDNVERVSRFRFHCFCVDGKARYLILNMSSHASYFGCTSCDFKGVSINRTMRYPAGPHELIPPFKDRTHSGMLLDMKAASIQGIPVRGHQGYTPLVLLDDVDLVRQGGFDDLHFLYECAAATHLDLLLTVAPKVKDSTGTREIAYAAVERTLDSRLSTIKTPSKISRKPTNMKIKNKKQFTGTELRNFLIYYGVPLFQDLIEPAHLKHFGMLSYIAFLLAQDSITQEELRIVEKLVEEYLELFDNLYGIERTRLNLHSLKHAVNSVQDLGPLWCYTTFNFESWNNKLLSTVTSPNAPILQIITRHLLHLHLEFTLSTDRGDISEDVKEQVRAILKKKRRAQALFVEEDVYALGTGTLKVPTQDEVQALLQKDLGTEKIMCYNKVLISGAEYQTKTSTSSNGLSDNSVLYTEDKTFCAIQNVVTFKNENGSNICGLFVTQKVVLHPPPFETAPHIQQLLPREEEELIFVPTSLVKSQVVQVLVKDIVYLIPMPNVLDID